MTCGGQSSYLVDIAAGTVRRTAADAPTAAIAWTPQDAPLVLSLKSVEGKAFAESAGAVAGVIEAHVPGSADVFTAAWRRDSAYAATTLGRSFGMEEIETTVWNRCTRQAVLRLDKRGKSGVEHRAVHAVSSDRGSLARSGQSHGGPALIDIMSSETRWQRPRMTAAYRNYMPPFTAEFSADGRSMACACVLILDIHKLYGRMKHPPQLYGALASDLVWSSAGARLSAAFTSALSGGASLVHYSSVNGEASSQWDAGFACWPQFSPDGRLCAGGLVGYRLAIAVTNNPGAVKKLPIKIDAAPTWSPDAKQLAVRNANATEIWDIETNECVRRFDGGASLVWSPDGSRFVLSGSGEVTIHDAASGNVLHELDDPPLGPAKVWPRLSWSPDSRHIAGRRRIWDAETGEVVARLPGAALAGETGAPAWSPDGATLAYLGPGRAVVVVGWALPTTRTDGLSIQTDDHQPVGRPMPSPSSTAMVGDAHPPLSS